MRTILAAVDGSPESDRAARMASDIAARFGAQLTLVNVVPPAILPNSPDPGVILPWDLVAVQAAEQSVAEKTLEETRRRIEAPGLAVVCRVERGQPAETIAKLAADLEADLVVVGNRGRGRVARVLLGSVSDRLAHICEKPVLVAR